MLGLAILCFSFALVRSQVALRDDVVYYTAEAIEEVGYPSQRHTVITPDGYILEMHRIPHGRNETSNTGKPVVFIMHGMSAASFAFIVLGPELSLAYLLADAGFDVWMGNARGTKPSRFHETLNPDARGEKRTFFNFSWDEIGMIDLPTMIEYVLKYTGRTNLHYIGHSQGGTTFLVLNSLRPEYNEKFLSVHLIAGVGYKENFPDETLRTLAQNTNSILNAANLLGLFEMYPPNSTNLILPGINFPRSGCAGDLMFEGLCWDQTLDRKMREDVVDHTGLIPGGGSMKQLAHYGQNIRDGIFRRFDHGQAQNNAAYGTDTPPIYNISMITANVTMHYSLNDSLLSEDDCLAMVANMPNAIARKVSRESFTHNDYLVAPDAKELVFDYIIEDMLRAERENVGASPDPIILPEVTTVKPDTDAASYTTLSFTLKMFLVYISFMILF